jgi:GTP-binding protein YchF
VPTSVWSALGASTDYSSNDNASKRAGAARASSLGVAIGLVGLPNVGKTTLFNALTHSRASVATYAFSTVEPNTAVVQVPDPRLQRLAAIYRPRKITPTVVTFVDVAGLVKGASRGEGLGNQFLGHLREVDALAMVVGCYAGSMEEPAAPLAQVQTVTLELVLADLETVSKRHEKTEKLVQIGKSKDTTYLEVLTRLRQHLDGGAPARTLPWTTEERVLLRDLQLLSLKPVLYIANVAEGAVAEGAATAALAPLATTAGAEQAPLVTVSAQIEAELGELDPAEAESYRESLGMTEPGTYAVIRAAYQQLGLLTFFTAGDTEVRAWTIRGGLRAPQAAGTVHSDFERGFIKAEVIASADLLAAGSVAAAREQGKVRLEGKDYLIREADIVLFRFNV